MSGDVLELLVCSVHRREMTVLLEGVETGAQVSSKLFREEGPAAGDLVTAEMHDGRPFVTSILPRRNSLGRPVLSGMQTIAANIDLAIVLVSIRNPPLRRGFIERSAASAVWSGIRVMVLVNKTDLAREEDLRALEALGAEYRAAGFGFGLSSCATGEGLEDVRTAVACHTVVITGPSGAGKTSLVGLLAGRDDLRTGDLNLHTGKGRHTTVGARLVPLERGGRLIDTPGMKALPVSHIPRAGLKDCFPELRELGLGCRFRDCMHSGEPGCAVAGAVERGALSAGRYAAYRSLLEEISRG